MNLWLIKFTVESMVNMKNRTDVSVLAGVRFQI
jgi:hypothetical protein